MSCKYQVRLLQSKGALLVLFWMLLMCMACFPYYGLFIESFKCWFSRDTRQQKRDLEACWLFPNKWSMIIPILIACLSAPAAGWMADAKFGNYRVFKTGVALLFLYSTLNCLSIIFEALFWENNKITFSWINFILYSSFFMIGSCMCAVTALPLGLDQMPDASASNITSFIAWFVFSLWFGRWIADTSAFLKDRCLDKTLKWNYSVISTFVLTLCLSIVLISNFLFSPKWLIIEPKSAGSLKIIYQVLKFAAKHKAPVNRSALTYWEEDIPSRVDLGKSKYGGPFTTEQVEDVKTILRLLVMSLPLCFVAITLKLPINTVTNKKHFPDLSLCLTNFRYFFTYSPNWCALLAIIAYEFAVYPFIRKKLPSSLKRMGTVSLMMTIDSFICFLIKLAHYLSHTGQITGWITDVLYNVTYGLLFQALMTSGLEFVCAQSPYNMRGFFISFAGALLIFSEAVSILFNYYLSVKCGRPWCSLILFSIVFMVSLIGFLLFCVVACWYKKRVRDDDYSPHRVVEEVYDRYLTAAAVAPQIKTINYSNTQGH